MQEINRSYNAKQKVEMEDYRRVAGDPTNTAGDKGQQVGDRAAEVVVPRGQTLELVEIMKRGLLGRSTISFLGRSHRTENCNSPSKVMSTDHRLVGLQKCGVRKGIHIIPLEARVVYAARILSTLMESVGAFGSVLPPLLSRGLLQQQRVSNTGEGGSSRHGSDSTPNLRARQYCTQHPHTSTRISHRHGDWRSWYARRLPPVHFQIERPQKRTGGSIHDRIGGPSVSPHQARRRDGLRSKSTRQNISHSARDLAEDALDLQHEESKARWERTARI